MATSEIKAVATAEIPRLVIKPLLDYFMATTGQASWEAEIEDSMSATSGDDSTNGGHQTPGDDQTTATHEETTTTTNTDDAAKGAAGGTVTGSDGNQGTQTQSQDTSLFNQSTTRDETVGTQGVSLKPNDLVMFGGKLTPWSQVEALQNLKPRYDQSRERESKLEDQLKTLAPKAQAFDGMAPTLAKLRQSPAGIAFIETLEATGDETKAKAAMDAVYAQLNPTIEQKADPRLVPPVDPDTGEPFQVDHPEHIRWLGSEARADALYDRRRAQEKAEEQRAERERQAKADADAKAKADAEAAAKATYDQTLSGIEADNKKTIDELSTLLTARGIDCRDGVMPPDQWLAVQFAFADAVEPYLPIRNVEWRQTHVIDKGHLASLLDNPLIIDKIKSAAGISTNGAKAIGADLGKDKGPESVVGGQTSATKTDTATRSQDARTQVTGGLYRPSRRSILQPGPASEAIPSDHARATSSPQDAVAQFEEAFAESQR